jgi:SnoaL-like domain
VLREPGNQAVGIQLMGDLMAPEGSIYYDAIYGDFHGQAAIRGWLLPTMASIDFIDFAPTAEPVLLDDGRGGTTVDEWEMVMVLGDDRIPLSRGVSVRRIRDGWITWACDVYDTGPFRVPPPPDMEVDESQAIPEWPRTQWTRDEAEAERAVADIDVDAFADRFHVSDAVYHDPIAGRLHGREAIRTWLRDVTAKAGNVVFEPLGPRLDNGEVSVQEWQQMALMPSGDRVFVTRGTSVRRSHGGEITYAADYYDTASLTDPEVLAARTAAGAHLG